MNKPFQPVIQSLLDTDLYKFTMWQSLLHAFPANQSEYRFKCRNKPAYPLSSLRYDVETQLDALCAMRFTDDDLEYLRTRPYFKSDFIDFLRIFHFQRRYISIEEDGDDLVIVAQGPQIHVMGFEVYVLSIVNELYFRSLNQDAAVTEGRKRLQAKVELLRQKGPETAERVHPFQFFDFGTRRRFSASWHDEAVATLSRELPAYFKGTSNVHLARKYGLVPIGTMAHEYLQTFQAVGVQLKQFQKASLEAWVQEYRGDLGIALTDVVGMDAFLNDFDLYFAKLFDGLRHDSGDPAEWTRKALAHYAKLRIDPHTKRLVYSDSLNLPKALALHREFADYVQMGFGIGTNLTNDMGIDTLNIVMKLITCNGQPVAKLADAEGKTMSVDETFLAYLRQQFNRT